VKVNFPAQDFFFILLLLSCVFVSISHFICSFRGWKVLNQKNK
jgi:hypothetical protein